MDEYLAQERMWGVVSRYNPERGFGFIDCKDDGKSYFVHASQANGEVLERGYLVEFTVGVNKRTGKEQAKNVIVIEATERKRRKAGRS